MSLADPRRLRRSHGPHVPKTPARPPISGMSHGRRRPRRFTGPAGNGRPPSPLPEPAGITGPTGRAGLACLTGPARNRAPPSPTGVAALPGLTAHSGIAGPTCPA
eukprot:4573152-Pyramimonas_sp.AAC.1